LSPVWSPPSARSLHLPLNEMPGKYSGAIPGFWGCLKRCWPPLRTIRITGRESTTSRKLAGLKPGEGQWRIRAGDYRLRYDVFGHDIVLYALRHRKEAYWDFVFSRLGRSNNLGTAKTPTARPCILGKSRPKYFVSPNFKIGLTTIGSLDHSSVFTRNPKASSNPVGTYLSSLFRRTHSFSSDELWYSSGEMFSALTSRSNELGEKASGLIASGFVKLRLTWCRRIKHLKFYFWSIRPERINTDSDTTPSPLQSPSSGVPLACALWAVLTIFQWVCP